MKGILALGLVLAVFVALSSATCERGLLTRDKASRKSGCNYKGTFHKMNSEWTSECMECTCSKAGLECCLNAAQPAGYDTQNCELTFNKESCSYTATKKDNPSETCEVDSWVL
ncbi:beta-microseminoprotein-like [Eleutherodactylus coqui]|uniref:beta-microseminoprotein-like n=1 Tax=Eleutherodactylus coqui TaxID=57060 RepID=UPI003462605B